MNNWLKNHFQSDDLPPVDIIRSSYRAAVKVYNNPQIYVWADFKTLSRLIEEMEADAEICNIIHE